MRRCGEYEREDRWQPIMAWRGLVIEEWSHTGESLSFSTPRQWHDSNRTGAVQRFHPSWSSRSNKVPISDVQFVEIQKAFMIMIRIMSIIIIGYIVWIRLLLWKCYSSMNSFPFLRASLYHYYDDLYPGSQSMIQAPDCVPQTTGGEFRYRT